MGFVESLTHGPPLWKEVGWLPACLRLALYCVSGFALNIRVSGVKMCDSKHCLVLPDFGRFGPVRQFGFYNLVDVWAFLDVFLLKLRKAFFPLGFCGMLQYVTSYHHIIFRFLYGILIV
jgi:hypothetical protein